MIDADTCKKSITEVKDALYVLNGKWKLPLIISLQEGPKRFNQILRDLGEITPKVLSKELKELEANEFVTRTTVNTVPVSVIYELTDYSMRLDDVIESLRVFGEQHRNKIMGKSRKPEAKL